MKAAAFAIKLQLILLVHFYKFNFTIAGTCWATMSRPGRCTEILKEKSSRDECCNTQAGFFSAWTPQDLDSGSLFFWRVLGGGVQCLPCKSSCDTIKCAIDKRCVVKKGIPKCVCSSKCKDQKLKPKGPICGTDGRSYKNVCRLKKRACRKKTTSLMVAYKGFCQNSCEKIKCPIGKHCLLDQNVNPHCVNCTRKCPYVPKNRQICGSDGLTYPSTCHLREKACRNGKAIPLAYKGPCKANATCKKVSCREQQLCLTDLVSGMPRCVTCSLNCRPRQLLGPVCGSNNSTYTSWCHMMQDSCNQGFIIDPKYNGKCANISQGPFKT